MKSTKIIKLVIAISLFFLIMSYSHSELNTNKSIFPYIQYYTWEIEENELNVNMDNWGFISSNGTGTAVIIGSYIYNPRVTIIINLTILE